MTVWAMFIISGGRAPTDLVSRGFGPAGASLVHRRAQGTSTPSGVERPPCLLETWHSEAAEGEPVPPCMLKTWHPEAAEGSPPPPRGHKPCGSRGPLPLDLNSCLGLPRARTTWTGATPATDRHWLRPFARLARNPRPARGHAVEDREHPLRDRRLDRRHRPGRPRRLRGHKRLRRAADRGARRPPDRLRAGHSTQAR